jgi:membrane protein implicated in regulation of membrane protease activity
MIAAGELAGYGLQTLGFVAVAKLIMHVALAPDPLMSHFIDPESRTAGFVACGAFAFLIALAGAIRYLSRRSGIRLAADFETERYADAIVLVRDAERNGVEVSPAIALEIQNLAPRYMGRMLMQLLNAIPAAIIASTALVISLWLNFVLTAMLAAVLITMAPLFMRFMMHSSRTSRRMKDATAGFGASKKALSKQLSSDAEVDLTRWRARIAGEEAYREFLDAYQGRLALAPFAQFLGAVSLSAVLIIFFVWFVTYPQAETTSLSNVVVSLILLRVFMQGVNMTLSAMTMMGSFYPFFANFITLTAGHPVVNANAGNAVDDAAEFV